MSVCLCVTFLSSLISVTIRARDNKFGMYVHLNLALNEFVLDYSTRLTPSKMENQTFEVKLQEHL